MMSTSNNNANNSNNIDNENDNESDSESSSSSSTSSSSPDNGGRFVLDPSFTPCSKSHIWKLMMSFYDRKGPDSWSLGIVPHFITSNIYIARAYAKTICAYIADCFRPNSPSTLDPTQPLYILELGAGPGKLSFYLLRALEELQEVIQFPIDKIMYVITDFTESNMKFWQNHPALKPYFEQGRLDMAKFDALNDSSIHLVLSDVNLQANTVRNPICIIANYLFDTLHHDIFQVESGQLKEGLVSAGSQLLFEHDPLEPTIIERLSNQYQYRPISTNYYSLEGGYGASEEEDEATFRRLLAWYQEYFKQNDASFLLPVGALRVLRRLCKFSNGHAIILSGDKGYSNPDQFHGLCDPHFAIHGSFSMMVNYHAIGAYFTNRGGFSLQSPQEDASLKVACFVSLPAPDELSSSPSEDINYLGDLLNRINESRAKPFPFLRTAFASELDKFGPADFFVLQKALKEDAPRPSLQIVVALLRLCDWDPEIFYRYRDVIISQAPTIGGRLRNDICRGMPRVWENYFILDRDKDIAFEIGRFYYALDDFKNALDFYEKSIETMGLHHITLHNQGLCYYGLGHLDKSLLFFRRALNLNPRYDKARCWIEKIMEEKEKARASKVLPQGSSNSYLITEPRPHTVPITSTITSAATISTPTATITTTTTQVSASARTLAAALLGDHNQ